MIRDGSTSHVLGVKMNIFKKKGYLFQNLFLVEILVYRGHIKCSVRANFGFERNLCLHVYTRAPHLPVPGRMKGRFDATGVVHCSLFPSLVVGTAGLSSNEHW